MSWQNSGIPRLGRSCLIKRFEKYILFMYEQKYYSCMYIVVQNVYGASILGFPNGPNKYIICTLHIYLCIYTFFPILFFLHRKYQHEPRFGSADQICIMYARIYFHSRFLHLSPLANILTSMVFTFF